MISRSLYATDWHVEPYESLLEMADRAPNRGILLVEDSANRLVEAIDWLKENMLWMPVIGFTAAPLPSEIVRAVLAGAIGYLAWPFSQTEFEETLSIMEHVRPGAVEFEQRRSRSMALLAGLSKREREVVDWMLDCYTNKEMALVMGISPKTVEIHRCNLMRKLGARGTADAVRIAVEAIQARKTLR